MHYFDAYGQALTAVEEQQVFAVIVYFPGHQHIMLNPVLGAWSLPACTVFLIWWHRHPCDRPSPEPAHHSRTRPLPG